MKKQIVVSSKIGKASFIFLLLAYVGIIFQFTQFYLPLIPISGGAPLAHTLSSFGILALAFGTIAMILTIFKIPKFIWIIFTVLTLVFIIIPPAIIWNIFHELPYAKSYALSATWLNWLFSWAIPVTPALDFVGFWMSFGFGLFAAISSFFIPKK